MITFRLFKEGDVQKISQFFGSFATENKEPNSDRKVVWDCFSKHPCFLMFQPEKIGIWENGSEIVGIVRLESPCLGEVIIDVDPGFRGIIDDMVHYAEEVFAEEDENGKRKLSIHMRESDKLQDRLKAKGYSKGIKGRMHVFALEEATPNIEIPTEFRLSSLEEVYNFKKLNDLLWRSFNYIGDPPAYDDEVYPPIKHAWLPFQREISIVAEAPNHSYASFCGMWFDDCTKSAFIEPLATAIEHRGLGLANACIYESTKKCKEKGAKMIYVEPDTRALGFYQKIGFKEAYESYYWYKHDLSPRND